ncbi:hypothetical protein [Tenacibaculum salmonis]|uniref:hypothetical protein n=1 Tax=Tenacibaculum sp. P3-BQ1 TaxID=3232310 RepID=UPI0034DE5EE5
MKKIYLSLVICLIFSAVFSQEKIASFENHLKTNGTNIKDVIPIVNKENDEIAMFIVDAKKIYAYKLNNKFKVTDELSSETKKRKYKVLLGSSINENNYRIFLSNKEKNKYASANFSFTDKKTVMNEFVFPKDEVFIQTITHLNKFYLFTVSNIVGKLYLYSFDQQGNPKKNEINLNGNMLVDKKNNLTKITDLLLKSNTGFVTINDSALRKIEKDTPNSIESVSEAKKMYIRGNNIVITFDHHKKFTQVISINIDTKELIKKTFNKPLENIKSRKKKTNSFLYDNYIAVIAGTKDVFSMYLLNYNTGKFIKEYSVAKDEQINFKNSPIIQKGGYYNNHRELEKTKQFLRKITTDKIGVSIIKNKDNNYQFTVGGYVKQASGGGMMMGGFGGVAMASFGSATLFFNPTMLAYNSFENTKSTTIECVFNQKLEHIKDAKTQKNVFDKIKKSKTPNRAASTVFKYKDYFIKGDSNSFGKTYTLKKFTN